MALIPPFYLDCVVAIGAPSEEGVHWIGTGFVVGRPLDVKAEPKKYHTFLVTNKHVLNGKRVIVLRFNTLQGAQVRDYVVQLEVGGVPIWVGHPSDGVDIASFNINPDVLKADGILFSFFHLDQHAMSVADMRSNGMSEGDSIYVLGFPMGIVSDQSNYVISRSGSVARIRDLLANRQLSFLIDANIFPGNSGGPVVTRPEIASIQGTQSINRSALIGIVKNYISYHDVAISQQTGRVRVIFEENSGLAFVETVDSIRETVELCFSQKVAKTP